MSGRGFKIQNIVGETVIPAFGLSEEGEESLSASYLIADANYAELKNNSDDSLLEIEEGADTTSVRFEAIRLLHNYLSSLYSYNEHLANLVHERVDAEVKGSLIWRSSGTQYSRDLRFLIGLRADCQHGNFSGIRTEVYENRYLSLRFDESGFQNGRVNDAEWYLEHTTPKTREDILEFVFGFHERLREFHEDSLRWFGSVE